MSGLAPLNPELPIWWPAGSEFALLDLRDGLCRLTRWSDADAEGVRTWSEPAFVRLTPQGRPQAWGRRAAAWKDRGGQGEVLEVFPGGWPADTGLARWYLARFAETYQPDRARCRILITEQKERRWTRRLWRESLEDAAFSVEGFQAPWQHELILAAAERTELAMGSYLHLALEGAFLSWSFIQGGSRLGGGRDPRLSRSRLFHLIAEYARRHLAVESAPEAISDLVKTTLLGAGHDSSRAVLDGRHLPSGLPIRQPFAWLDFLRADGELAEGWFGIKQRIAEQALECCQVAMATGPGLDLPGWRVLAAEEFTELFLEGPLARMLEERG